MKIYFDRPTQVRFFEGESHIGIAYKDEIICACCGKVFSVKDVEKYGPIEDLGGWVNFSEYIE